MDLRNEHIRLIVLTALLSSLALCCHSQEQKLYRVRPGESLMNSVWRDSLYRFPDFRDGRVTFIKGVSKTYKMNYSLLSEEMEFIDPQGDSLILNGTPDLRIVNIGGKIFYHHPRVGYIEVLLQLPIALGVKHFLNVERKEVIGDNGYGQTSFITTSVSSFYRQSPNAFSNYDILYEKASIFFFIDPKNTPMVATRSSLFKLFPDNKEDLKKFLREYKINFRREQDMVALTNFMARFY